jgi:hypothetical protein
MLGNRTVNMNALCVSSEKIACYISESILTFLYAGSSIQNASGQFFSCIHFSFLNFALSKLTDKILTELDLEIQFISVTIQN